MNEIVRMAEALPPGQKLITGTVAEVQRQVLAGTRSMQFRRVSEISALGDFAWVVVEPTHLFRHRTRAWIPLAGLGVAVLVLVAYLVATYAAVVVLGLAGGLALAYANARRTGPAVNVDVSVRVDR
jgi:hypothetical protein